MEHLNYFQEHLFCSLQSPILSSSVVDDLGNTTSEEVTPRYRDIHFLINQKALENLDPSSLSQFLEPLNSSTPSDDMSLSDEQLTLLCSSRYVQQPTDVKAFADFLTSKADEVKSKFTKSQEREKAWKDFVKSVQNDVNTSSVDNNTSDN